MQLNAGFADQIIPTVGLHNLFLVISRFLFRRQIAAFFKNNAIGEFAFRIRFFCHLQKKDVGKLGDILVICDAIIPQHIAEIPELRYNFLCVHAAFPPSS